MRKRESGILPITDEKMTRFNISLSEGVDMVLWTIKNLIGGEILVPKIPSFRVVDLAKAVAPECKQEIIGIRPGEKIHEVLITENDSPYTHDLGLYYSILSQEAYQKNRDLYNTTEKVPMDFVYCSGTNKDFLSIDKLREIIDNFNLT